MKKYQNFKSFKSFRPDIIIKQNKKLPLSFCWCLKFVYLRLCSQSVVKATDDCNPFPCHFIEGISRNWGTKNPGNQQPIGNNLCPRRIFTEMIIVKVVFFWPADFLFVFYRVFLSVRVIRWYFLKRSLSDTIFISCRISFSPLLLSPASAKNWHLYSNRGSNVPLHSRYMISTNVLGDLISK